MDAPEHRRRLIEAIEEQNLSQERLFQLIAALANFLDRPVVIETMQHILHVDPIEDGDRVLFDDIAVSFDGHGRVKGLYRIIDGRPQRAAEKKRSGP